MPNLLAPASPLAPPVQRPLPPRTVAAMAALVALATRLPFLPRQLHDHDSVNFAHALGQFDLARHSPHLPGYPVYLALAKIAHLLGAPAAAALAWPGLLGAMAATAALAGLLAPRLGNGAALSLAVLYLLLPDLALADVRPLSDGLGAHLTTLLALAALLATAPGGLEQPQRQRFGHGAMVLAGALLGVRLSNWPMVAIAGIALLGEGQPRRERLLRLGILASAVLAWAVPLVGLAGGPGQLLTLSLAFAQGHFGQWRGDAPPLGLVESAALWLGHLGRGGALLLGLAVAAMAAQARDRRGLGLPLAMAGAYALWLIVGQNPERARHVAPLTALGAVAMAWLATRVPQTQALRLAVPLALAALGAVTLPLQRRQQTEPTPDVAMGLWLASQPTEGALVLGGSEVGVLRWQAPVLRSLRVATPKDLQAMLADPATRAPRLLATSRVPGLDQLARRGLSLEPVAHFAARPRLDLPQQALTVYRVRPPQRLALQPRQPEVYP